MNNKPRYIIVMPTLDADDNVGMTIATKIAKAATAAGFSPIVCGSSNVQKLRSQYFTFYPCFSKINKNKYLSIFKKLFKKLFSPLTKFLAYQRSTDRHISSIGLFWIIFFFRTDIHYYICIRKFVSKIKIQSCDKIFIPNITTQNFPIWALFAATEIHKSQAEFTLFFDKNFRLGNKLSDYAAAIIFEKSSMRGKLLSITEDKNFIDYFIKEFALPIRFYPQIRYASDIILKKIILGIAIKEINLSPKILIFYSLKNLQSISSGSSLRLYLIMRYLKENSCRVHICIPKQHVKFKNCLISFYNIKENYVDKIIFFIHKIQQKIFLSKYRDIIQFITYIRNRENRKLRRKLSKILLSSNVIFVEHILYLDMITPLSKMADIPIFVTLYDDDSNRCYITYIKNFIRKIIIRRLEKVEKIATVEKTEHEMLNRYGLKNYLIPSTADTKTFFSGIIETDNKLDKTPPNILFVGSNYYPNIEAKNNIFYLAQKAKFLGHSWKFTIVGDCASPIESTSNVCATGVLSHENLVKAYANATLLISPLTSGVGAAVKAIEGLGTGKPFLGTSTTFRGLDVHNRRECFIEDNLEKYIERIQEILEIPEYTKMVGLCGKKFAEQYDFRNIFRPYLDFIYKEYPIKNISSL